ncbi:hypothetical protein C8Q80DRAFT_731064 [Daedaleopsis nitida]|nr:hypothetical protein C8Q80DRAFT_731064 [Daedaleopsis nitida]
MLRVCRAVWQQRMWTRPSCVACRHLSTPLVSRALPEDFAFFPDFFTVDEQYALLKAALRKLDGMESGRFRRRRREYLGSPSAAARASSFKSPVQSLFLPDEFYDFQEGHFDGVIKRYREMHVTSWPEDVPEVIPLLERLRGIHPKQDTQTHILHLASDGQIFPHVDNVEDLDSRRISRRRAYVAIGEFHEPDEALRDPPPLRKRIPAEGYGSIRLSAFYPEQ